MTAPSGVIFFDLLADRDLQPLAVRLVAGVHSMGALANLLTQADFKVLATRCVCLIDTSLATSFPDQISAQLKELGVTELNADALCHCDAAAKPEPAAGVLWVDGNWFLAPPAKTTGAPAASRVMALKLVQLVGADADTRELEDVFRQDPTLSYHLLRLVNSLAFGASRRISSFSQAILMLGRTQLKRWLNLILFAAGSDDPRSAMLLGRVVVRARMMELLARETGGDRAQQELAFMAGMFSMLGVLFGQPLAEVFKPLQLDEVLQSAILAHQGPIGQMLEAVESAERLDETGVCAWLIQNQLSVDVYNQLMLGAVLWMLAMRQEGADA